MKSGTSNSPVDVFCLVILICKPAKTPSTTTCVKAIANRKLVYSSVPATSFDDGMETQNLILE